MNDVGGRPELAPYPDWAARYIDHKNSLNLNFVLQMEIWRVRGRCIFERLMGRLWPTVMT